MISIKQILSGDSYDESVQKINENFQQIMVGGGGPQGAPGNSGFPGLPGRDGRQGPPGLEGETGTRFTIFDSNNPGTELYPPTNLTAQQAILDGHVEGDTWLDQLDNTYYILSFSPTPNWVVNNRGWTSGEQTFKKSDVTGGNPPRYEHNILNNIYFLNDGKIPSSDLDHFNISTCISSVKLSTSIDITNNVYNHVNFRNPVFGTWDRKSFKLTIDQVRQEAEFSSIAGPFSTNIYNNILEGKEFTPILFLGERYGTQKRSNFGFLTYSTETSSKQILSILGDQDSSNDIYMGTNRLWADGDVLLNISGTNAMNSFSAISGMRMGASSTWYGNQAYSLDPITVFSDYRRTTGMEVHKEDGKPQTSIIFYTSDDPFHPTENEKRSKNTFEIKSSGNVEIMDGNLVVTKGAGINKVLMDIDGSGKAVWSQGSSGGTGDSTPYFTISMYPKAKGTDANNFMPSGWHNCDGKAWLLTNANAQEPWKTEYGKDVYFITPDLSRFASLGFCMRNIIKLPPDVVQGVPTGNYNYVCLGGQAGIDHIVTPTPLNSVSDGICVDCNTGTPPAQFPTSSFTVTPTTGHVGTTLFEFNGSTSSDPVDGENIELKWEGIEGVASAWESYTTGKLKNNKTFASIGTKNIKLHVRNTSFLEDVSEKDVIIADGLLKPDASFTVSPASGKPGDTFTFTSTAVNNNDPTEPLEYSWHLGEGNWTLWSANGTITHPYTTVGTKTIQHRARVKLDPTLVSDVVTGTVEITAVVGTHSLTFNVISSTGTNQVVVGKDESFILQAGEGIDLELHQQTKMIGVNVRSSGGGNITVYSYDETIDPSAEYWYLGVMDGNGTNVKLAPVKLNDSFGFKVGSYVKLQQSITAGKFGIYYSTLINGTLERIGTDSATGDGWDFFINTVFSEFNNKDRLESGDVLTITEEPSHANAIRMTLHGNILRLDKTF